MLKFGRKVPYLRCDSRVSFKVKRSKVRLEAGGGISCRPNPTATLINSYTEYTQKKHTNRKKTNTKLHAEKQKRSNLPI